MNQPELRPGEVIPEDQARPFFAHFGSGAKLYRGCRIINPEKIRVGQHSQIDECVFIFAGQGVEIGSHVHLSFGSSISGGGQCIIRDFAGIGAGVRLITGTDLLDTGGLTNPTVPDEFRTVNRGRIEIGAHAVVFTNSVILPDVKIGEGAVVSAGSVVHHDLKAWAIYGGNPLVQIGVREKGEILKKADSILKKLKTPNLG